jgi:hypothetical protein
VFIIFDTLIAKQNLTMCPVPAKTSTTITTTTTSKTDDANESTPTSTEKTSTEKPSIEKTSTESSTEKSSKKRFYDLDDDAETEVWQLSAIASDWTLTINRMAANCRNISDEVYPGIHVGDRFYFDSRKKSF